MAVVKMKKLSLAAASCDADELMQKLMWTGSVEVSDAASAFDNDDRITPDEKFSRKLSELSATLSRYERALLMLKPHEKAPKGLFPARAAYKRELYDSPGETLERASTAVARVEEVIGAIDDATAKEARIKNSLAFLAPWRALDLKLSVKGTESTELLIGTLPRTAELENVISELANESELSLLSRVGESENAYYVCVFALKQDADKVSSLLSRKGFIRADFSQYSESAATEYENLLTQSNALESEKLGLETALKKLAQSSDIIRIACDIVSTEMARTEAQKKLICTRSAVILSGWIPEKKMSTISKILESYECFYEFSDPEEGDDVPVALSNPEIAKPFESIIDMYVLPAYGTFDPTVIMAFFYFIIFGLMLADVAYGLILAIGGFIALKKFDLAKGVRQLVKLFATCGIACTIAGVFLGSYFGDLPSQLSQAFGGEAFTMPLTLIDPLNDPIMFIVVALAVGLIHMLAGLAIKFYVICKERSFFAALFDVGGWFIVFAGAGLYFLIGKIGLIVLGVGIAVMMIGGALSKTGIFGRVVGSFGALYGFVGFASDLISYSRIMALGLTSAIIASVFNILATIALPSPIGFVLFVIVLTLGHLLNLGINLIGTFVHASRLQYIEFFGKFYEDGGRKFSPLTTAEKYTKIADPEDRD
ncbi:MAG: V-type ATP synthase subunit I [Ruminococcaceae bacterium]|nr:V-type ATP synthase subunit I [Oscillospiraceae bacterium]